MKRFKISPDILPFLSKNFLAELIDIESGKATFTFSNSNPFFINRALQCQIEKNKFPNFLTVDFYDLGNTNEVVSMLNGIVSSINENNVCRKDTYH